MNCPLNVLYLYNIFVIFFQFSCFAHQSSHKKIAKICLVIFKEKVNLVPLVGTLFNQFLLYLVYQQVKYY